MPRKAKPDLIDDESPEAGAEWFARARPAAEVLPGLVGPDAARAMLKPKRGRPPLAVPKAHVNIRLDADIVEAFKHGGNGWQTRINGALRQWLRAEAKASAVHRAPGARKSSRSRSAA